MLLASGGDPNLPARTSGVVLVSPLWEAAREGEEETVRCLLAAGARVGLGLDPVKAARSRGHSGVVVMLEEARTGGRLLLDTGCRKFGVNIAWHYKEVKGYSANPRRVTTTSQGPTGTG